MTEYEKEPYHVEHKFEMTEWDKSFFTVTIDEPYVVELWEHYTAQIQVPYEVTNIRDLTVWEIEEYTVSQEVPFVVENPTIVTDVQQEAYTVTNEETRIRNGPLGGNAIIDGPASLNLAGNSGAASSGNSGAASSGNSGAGSSGRRNRYY